MRGSSAASRMSESSVPITVHALRKDGFNGPIDIPESVMGASGANAQAGALLSSRRGKLDRERVYPEERDVTDEEPKVGVFACHCGANIGRVVDIPSGGGTHTVTMDWTPDSAGHVCMEVEIAFGGDPDHSNNVVGARQNLVDSSPGNAGR